MSYDEKTMRVIGVGFMVEGIARSPLRAGLDDAAVARILTSNGGIELPGETS